MIGTTLQPRVSFAQEHLLKLAWMAAVHAKHGFAMTN
jgi:hypothetical protein